MKLRLRSIAGISLLAMMFLTGCESPQPAGPPQGGSGAAVSALPWNKPASWEGAGALGGFMPQGGR